MNALDANGQPPMRFYADRVSDRLVAELLGLCKGFLADGIVTEAESQALLDWLNEHPLAVHGFPGRELAARLRLIYDDGHATAEELESLRELLESITGLGTGGATRIAFDHPEPAVLFEGREFVLTGAFVHGTRTTCERAVIDRGGGVHKEPRRSTDYLVVGLRGSDAWAQSSWGTKILHAMDLRESGKCPIKIIGEGTWADALRA